MEEQFSTAVAYDVRTTKHVHPTKKHLECPERVTVPYGKLMDSGILDRCLRITESRMARDDELALIHDPAYIEELRNYDSSKEFSPCRLPETWPSYMSEGTYEAAICATGSTLSLIDAISSGVVENGVALVRPPGHHAEVDESCGFCFFNTVAVAARYAQTVHSVSKVLILDWDIHHGNGIQHAFYDDPNVLYVSIHRFDNGDYFPNLREANHDYCGIGAGEGFNVNIPWNKDLMGDAEYKLAFDRLVLPIVSQFAPELILVAAGFDAAAADPLGEYIVSSAMYAYMTQRLLPLVSGGRLALILEGGYSPSAIGAALEACLEVLLGGADPVDVDLSNKVPCKRALQTISSVILSQSKYWKL